MVKQFQIIHRQKPTNCLSVFDHFVGLVHKGLTVRIRIEKQKISCECCQEDFPLNFKKIISLKNNLTFMKFALFFSKETFVLSS